MMAFYSSLEISIHALREEGDLHHLHILHKLPLFLSTPSARRATDAQAGFAVAVRISIHALREEGDKPFQLCDILFTISIHALREEGDACFIRPWFKTDQFLSTPSARRATSSAALRLSAQPDFYPRPPRGGRQQKQRQNLYFQTNYTTFCTNLEEP